MRERNVSMDDYRAWPEVANSDLKNLKRSPAYALWRRHNEKSTTATAFGTAVHTAVLEPHLLDEQYTLEPQQPKDNEAKLWRGTKLYKAARDEILEGGKDILSQDDFDSCRWIRDNVAKDPIGEMIAATQDGTEWSVRCNGRKIRPDVLCPGARTVVDLKTSAFASPWKFAKQCHDFMYHMGAAYYLDVLEEVHGHTLDDDYENYVFLVVPSDPPHEVYSYTLDDDSMAQGRYEFNRLHEQWLECATSNEWPAGPGVIQEIRIPQYGINFHLENGEA